SSRRRSSGVRSDGMIQPPRRGNAGPLEIGSESRFIGDQPLRLRGCSSIHRFRISGHILENLCDDMVGGDAFGFGLEIQDQTMPKRRRGGGLEVVKADVE